MSETYPQFVEKMFEDVSKQFDIPIEELKKSHKWEWSQAWQDHIDEKLNRKYQQIGKLWIQLKFVKQLHELAPKGMTAHDVARIEVEMIQAELELEQLEQELQKAK